MIKIIEKEVGPRGLEMCKCCGKFFSNKVLYEITISPINEITKEMQNSGTTFLLCSDCRKELKENL